MEWSGTIRQEKRNIFFVPYLTRPHVCRHTFCSRMAAARMNPKTLQYIMGHSDIGVTLNVYTHLGFDEASEEINRIAKEKKKQPAVKEEKMTELKVVGV